MAEMPATTWDEHVKRTQERLHSMYMTHVKPLEDRYKYDAFKPSWFEETIVNQKPFITFFGPWSAGKSSFINYLLQSNIVQTGPHPTTAEFTALLYGDEPGPLDGRVVANAKDLPFKGLNEFGESFLNAFQGYQVPHEILKNVTLIDTPGVLESAKDIHQRKYDYIKLSRWFAERSDLIFVLFDPTKLDAGQEMRMLFRFAFKGQESKLRIVLNKSDSVNTQELMRVYGSLFWNLSNMVDSTEPPRVFVGSFWDQPYQPGTFHRLFSEEKTDLIHEITNLVPAQALDKKIASLIRRAKEVFVHSIIVGGMRSGLPMFFGKDKAKQKALDELPKTYERVAAQHKMNWKDFPPTDDYRSFLSKFDIETFPDIDKVEKEGLLTGIRHLIDTLLPRMIRPVKTAPISDPRDKEGRRGMNEAYNQQLRDQFTGKQGTQGSSDLQHSALRPSAIADLHNGQAQFRGACAGAMDVSSSSMGAGNVGLGGGMAPEMMAQMMQMMQKIQQQQSASGTAASGNAAGTGRSMMGGQAPQITSPNTRYNNDLAAHQHALPQRALPPPPPKPASRRSSNASAPSGGTSPRRTDSSQNLIHGYTPEQMGEMMRMMVAMQAQQAAELVTPEDDY